jgi:hypothetical protein
MVILGKVGICGAWFLDSLKAISCGIEGDRPIGVESICPMGPVKDNSDTFWVCTCGQEERRSVTEER